MNSLQRLQKSAIAILDGRHNVPIYGAIYEGPMSIELMQDRNASHILDPSIYPSR